MDLMYEISPEDAGHLQVGAWVEIFKADAPCEERDVIRVRRMRVEGKPLVFSQQGDRPCASVPMRPHEGRISFVEEIPGRTRFGLRLHSQ